MQFLRLLSEPETILSIGMLAAPPAISLLSAKAAHARPPAVQNDWKHEISYINLKNPESQADPAVNLFERYTKEAKPISPVIKTEKNGFVAESFEDKDFKVTIVKKDGQLQGVYTYIGPGFMGVARNPNNPDELMSQVTGVSPGSQFSPGCALQPNGSPIFVSKTHMFVVDWVDDGKVRILNLEAGELISGVNVLDPTKLIVKEYSQEKDGSGLIIFSSELNGLFFVLSNPENIGFYQRGTKAFSNVVKSLLTQDEQNLIASR